MGVGRVGGVRILPVRDRTEQGEKAGPCRRGCRHGGACGRVGRRCRVVVWLEGVCVVWPRRDRSWRVGPLGARPFVGVYWGGCGVGSRWGRARTRPGTGPLSPPHGHPLLTAGPRPHEFNSEHGRLVRWARFHGTCARASAAGLMAIRLYRGRPAGLTSAAFLVDGPQSTRRIVGTSALRRRTPPQSRRPREPHPWPLV